MQKKSYFKRYLELFHFLDWKARLMLFFEVYHAFYKIFVIQITASIIGTIETSDPNKLIFLVKIFIALTIGYYISNRLSNMLSDAALPETRNRLYHYYMKRYISMDVTQTDRYGTGKFIGIFSEGIYQISNIYLRLGVDTVVGVLGVLYAIVLVAVQSPNIYYFMAIIAISVVSFSLFWKGIMQMQSARKISKEFTLTGTRQLAKIIMSKMEILQNNKIDGELKVFTETNNGVRDVWIKADNKKHIFQSLANMCFDGGRVFLFL
jgi:ABC-type transport system involved in cytochrome bd biosynthesis fused ATPase/permease subunit